jgi:hypothetical protein
LRGTLYHRVIDWLIVDKFVTGDTFQVYNFLTGRKVSMQFISLKLHLEPNHPDGQRFSWHFWLIEVSAKVLPGASCA